MTARIIVSVAALSLTLWAMGGCDQSTSAQRDAPIRVAASSSDHGHDHAHPHDTLDDHALLHAYSDPDAPCRCDEAVLVQGWCPRCNVGWVAGVRIESAELYEVIDPHGHQVDLSTFPCESCQAAIPRDGFCDACGVGFRRGLAFFTKITHAVDGGVAVDPDAIECPVCLANSIKPGWCDACGVGMIGNTVIAERALFDDAAPEYGVLLNAISMAPSCEMCAGAMVMHRTCPVCKIDYGEVYSGL